MHESAAPAEWVHEAFMGARSVRDSHETPRPTINGIRAQQLCSQRRGYTALGRQQCRLASRRVACMAHLAQRDAALIIHGVSR
ncbi:MAG: Queuosine Biosynthesis QueC ATPase [uncultured Paraburkholderia sp.]|nr:MAG: Queuosine Biosynthesis QueC ATPase [uncultured Paraburkholderia sp.]